MNVKRIEQIFVFLDDSSGRRDPVKALRILAGAGIVKLKPAAPMAPYSFAPGYYCTKHPLASGVTFPLASSAMAKPFPFRLMTATTGAVPGDEDGVPPVCLILMTSPSLNGPATNELPVSLT